MGLTTITDENKSPGASVERNRRVLTGAPARVYVHMRRRESGTKMGQRAVGSKPRLQTCIYYTSARARRRGEEAGTMRAGDAPLPMHFSTKTTSTRCTMPHIYVKRDLFSACNYERSPHLALIRFSVQNTDGKRRIHVGAVVMYTKTVCRELIN